MGGPTRVDYAGAACKMRGKHERNHKFVVALPRAQAFDRRRQFGRGTTRNHPEPPRNHPKSAAEPPRNHPGTTAEPIRNPARPNPIGTCGASICLNWHWLVTGSMCPTPRVCLCFFETPREQPSLPGALVAQGKHFASNERGHLQVATELLGVADVEEVVAVDTLGAEGHRRPLHVHALQPVRNLADAPCRHRWG